MDYFDIQSTIFSGPLYNNEEYNYFSTLSDLFLSSVVTPTTKKISKNMASYSNYDLPIEYTEGRLAGYSRNHGDASSQVQMSVMQKILNASSELPPEDQSLLLAFARLESGFNPDAAATGTSAAGVFQFINSTGKAYGLKESSRFDADANIEAGVKFYKDNLAIVDKKFPGIAGPERAAKLYALHHDGPSLKYGGEDIAKKGILPYIDKFISIVNAYRENS